MWQVELTSVEAAVVLLAEARGDPDAGLDLVTDVPRGQQVEQHHRDRVLLHVIVTEILINIIKHVRLIDFYGLILCVF